MPQTSVLIHKAEVTASRHNCWQSMLVLEYKREAMSLV